MKKSLIICFAIFSWSTSYAQETGSFNFSIGGGLALVDEGVFPAITLEPKVQVSDNVRFGAVGKIGFATRFRAFYADLNVKPSSSGKFYLGLGIGNSTYEGVELTSGFNSASTKENGLTVIPSIGSQGKIDFNLSMFIVQEVSGITLTVSRVIGYKDSSSD